jgi:hypothetical protein
MDKRLCVRPRNEIAGRATELTEMKNNLFRSARILFVVVVVIVAGSSMLNAIDGNNRYFAYGLGQRTCDDYLKFRDKRLETLDQHPRYTKGELYEIVEKVIEHWIAGFLTAHNYYVSDTYDVAGRTDINDVKARLERNCKANTKQYFVQAMISVVQELNPERVKAGSGK